MDHKTDCAVKRSPKLQAPHGSLLDNAIEKLQRVHVVGVRLASRRKIRIAGELEALKWSQSEYREIRSIGHQ